MSNGLKRISERLKQKKIRKFIRENQRLYFYADDIRIMTSSSHSWNRQMVTTRLFNYKNQEHSVHIQYENLPDIDDASLKLKQFENILLRLK